MGVEEEVTGEMAFIAGIDHFARYTLPVTCCPLHVARYCMFVIADPFPFVLVKDRLGNRIQ